MAVCHLSCWAADAGQVLVAGEGQFGQLGLGPEICHLARLQILTEGLPPGSRAVTAACGMHHTLLLLQLAGAQQAEGVAHGACDGSDAAGAGHGGSSCEEHQCGHADGGSSSSDIPARHYSQGSNACKPGPATALFGFGSNRHGQLLPVVGLPQGSNCKSKVQEAGATAPRGVPGAASEQLPVSQPGKSSGRARTKASTTVWRPQPLTQVNEVGNIMKVGHSEHLLQSQRHVGSTMLQSFGISDHLHVTVNLRCVDAHEMRHGSTVCAMNHMR